MWSKLPTFLSAFDRDGQLLRCNVGQVNSNAACLLTSRCLHLLSPMVERQSRPSHSRNVLDGIEMEALSACICCIADDLRLSGRAERKLAADSRRMDADEATAVSVASRRCGTLSTRPVLLPSVHGRPVFARSGKTKRHWDSSCAPVNRCCGRARSAREARTRAYLH